MKFITLSGLNGSKIPIVGLGTWRAQPDETVSAVLAALECGYRHIGDEFCFFFIFHY